MLRHKAIRLEPLDCSPPPGEPVHWTGPDGERVVPDWAEHLYPDLQRYRLERWAELVTAFEAAPDDFYNAYHWLANHPIFYRFQPWRDDSVGLYHERHLLDDQGLEAIHLMVVKVNPKTLRIGKDERRNTRTRIWWEAGPWLWGADCPPDDHAYAVMQPHGIGQHDWRMDGGADSYEQAIITLAARVHRRYGNDRRRVSW